MNNIIVIYHAGCRDGFCAAWIVNKYLRERTKKRLTESKDGFILENDVIYHPAFYGVEPPDVKDKDVIIVDFCYSLEQMKQIGRDAKSVIWLDHHKTAEPVANSTDISSPSNMFTNFIFDINRSGAGLAWDYFFGEDNRYRANNRPWLVDYVEDRDLWRHKLGRSEIVNAYIACLKFDFAVWDKVSTNTEPPFEYGSVAMMKTEQYVREVCKNVYFANFNNNRKATEEKLDAVLNYKQIKYDNENIPVCNIAQVDCSEVMAKLLELYPQSPFSMYWFKRADGICQYGLRSRQSEDVDVSVIAKLFGGGGHKNAAGFQLSYLLEELK